MLRLHLYTPKGCAIPFIHRFFSAIWFCFRYPGAPPAAASCALMPWMADSLNSCLRADRVG